MYDSTVTALNFKAMDEIKLYTVLLTACGITVSNWLPLCLAVIHMARFAQLGGDTSPDKYEVIPYNSGSQPR